MAYKDFTLERLEAEFGIKNQKAKLFEKVDNLEPSSWLLETLALGKNLPIRSEKSRSELIVTPILLETIHRNQDFITFYSGERLDADKKHGLIGECDFLITRDTRSYSINAPLIAIVEAKKQDIDLGINQCAAQLYGAKIFNDARNTPIQIIYGCVTTGKDWLFLNFENNLITVDTQQHKQEDLSKLLGIFQAIIDLNKTNLN